MKKLSSSVYYAPILLPKNVTRVIQGKEKISSTSNLSDTDF